MIFIYHNIKQEISVSELVFLQQHVQSVGVELEARPGKQQQIEKKQYQKPEKCVPLSIWG